APLFLGLAAISAFSWFVDALMPETYRPSKSEEEAGEKAPEIGWRRGLVRLIGFLGIPFGVLCLASLVSILFNPGHPFGDLLTLILLGWAAIALFLTPFTKISWAALLGVAAGVGAAILVALYVPSIVTEFIPLSWLLIIAFILVGVFVFALFKWAEAILQLICGIFGSRPLLLILAFAAFAQAIALVAVYFLFGGAGGILYFFFH
ncbi:MAG: hypothetical protein ACFFCO_12625, partial [Promethearchaeota archaeon]